MRPLFRAGLVLGLGMGGFIDGIVLHQILGWHHLICRTETCQPQTVAELLQQNTEDGFFHLAVWIFTLFGIALLYRTRQDVAPGGGGTLAGGMLAGWGLFNLVEGLIDHHILQIHHVRPGHPQSALFDLLFLASGVVLIAAGFILARKCRPPSLR